MHSFVSGRVVLLTCVKQKAAGKGRTCTRACHGLQHDEGQGALVHARSRTRHLLPLPVLQSLLVKGSACATCSSPRPAETSSTC
eukprot:362836-Chlamydomonas_euryale.AAC.8